MNFLPGINMNEIVDGHTLAEIWQYYTVNVKYLETVSHEQFCKEYPNAAVAIERASRIMDKMNKLAQE